jgi:hypothetical protein
MGLLEYRGLREYSIRIRVFFVTGSTGGFGVVARF